MTQPGPPCHHHQRSSKPSGDDSSCRHFLFVAEAHARIAADSNPIQSPAIGFFAVFTNARVIPEVITAVIPACAISPPGAVTKEAAVLRI
jgi:hypothetical protein